MINIYAYEDLGHANHGWLDTRHHFSFASYYHPERMGFGVLRVVNDDKIQAASGFDTHPHKDMEIITYVRKGAITHKDSQGNDGRTTAGNVQVMSAGSGVFHSEFNLEDEETTMYQIWIEPNKMGVTPQWGAHMFPHDPVTSELMLLVSGDSSAPLSIQQDAKIFAGRLTQTTAINHPITHQAYVLVSQGEVSIDGHSAKQGDGIEITDQASVTIVADSDAEVLLIDVPKK